jgi:hypothetical protein
MIGCSTIFSKLIEQKKPKFSKMAEGGGLAIFSKIFVKYLCQISTKKTKFPKIGGRVTPLVVLEKKI